MAGRVAPYVDNTGLVFAYDQSNTVRSYLGEPTTNSFPGYSLYAYASGPVDTPVYNERNELITAKRYTITQAVNTARAATLPTGLTTGVAYTFSFKWKYTGSTTGSPSMSVSAAKGNPEGGANNNGFASQAGDTVAIGNGWYLTTYIFVFSSCPTGGAILTFGISTGSTSSYVGETFDVYEAQFEVKDHKTPYTTGTRSATQGLKDLTGRSTIDLSNVSFDSNAQMTFDGTNDYIALPTGLLDGTGDFTVEAVVQADATEIGGTVFGNYPSGELQVFFGSRYIGMYLANASTYLGTSPWSTTLPEFTTNTVHILTLRSGTTTYFYINGELKKTGSSSSSIGSTSAVFRAGTNTSTSEQFTGDIHLLRVYNRALTASEIQQNFNAVRGRYGI